MLHLWFDGFSPENLSASLYAKPYVHTTLYQDPEPQINKQMLEMFQSLKDSGVITSTAFEYIMQNPEKVRTEGWQKVLADYQESLQKQENPIEHEDFRDKIAQKITDIDNNEEDTIVANQETENKENASLEDETLTEETITEETIIEESVMEEDVMQDVIIRKNLEDSETTRTDISAVNPSVAGYAVRYHVQIAASKTPLDETYLRTIYSGERDINHFKEDGWEKYTIGNFSRYRDAQSELQNRVDTHDAFIIAYLLGKKVMAYKARMVEDILANTPLDTFHENPDTQYRIQIAASTIPLSLKKLETLYPHTDQIGIIYEGGWFKYSIPGADTRESSWDLSQNLRVRGSFVVQYQSGKRLFP
ncbi:MAG: hypothetical protein ACOCW7_03060 [Bacteroidota bacterium]